MKKANGILILAMAAVVISSSVVSSWGYAPVVRVGINLIDDAVEAAAKVSGRSLGAAARKAAVRQVSQAVLKHGDDVLRTVRHGGVELIEAAAKYGDDVWSFSRQVPAATRMLALRADELVPEKSPEVFHDISKEVIRPFTLPVFFFGTGIAAILLWRFHRNNRWLKGRKKEKQVEQNGNDPSPRATGSELHPTAYETGQCRYPVGRP